MICNVAFTPKVPAHISGKTYWDLDAYVPQLALADPMAMLVSRGNEKDGTLRVAAASASVQVTLAPRASKIVLQKDSQTASDQLTAIEEHMHQNPNKSYQKSTLEIYRL